MDSLASMAGAHWQMKMASQWSTALISCQRNKSAPVKFFVSGSRLADVRATLSPLSCYSGSWITGDSGQQEGCFAGSAKLEGRGEME